RVGGSDEAAPRPPASVPVHVDERARRPRRRRLGLEDDLAHEQLPVVVRRAVGSIAPTKPKLTALSDSAPPAPHRPLLEPHLRNTGKWSRNGVEGLTVMVMV